MSAPREVRIVGGGLAGLALGVGLRHAGIPVTLHEAGEYPRHRVCGEFIAGLAPNIAQKLGIETVFENALHHRSVRWFSGDRSLATLSLPEPAIGLSRFVLDERLAALFTQLGGSLHTRSRLTADFSGEGWINTTGRRRANTSPWAGLKVHVRGIELADDLELHLARQTYVGLARVEDGWINLCGLFRKRAGMRVDSVPALMETLRGSGLHALATRLEYAEIRDGSASAVAGFTFDRRMHFAPNTVNLGDACALIPPFTGNGMAMAFTSAALALDPLVEWANYRSPWTEITEGIQSALQREFNLRLNGAAILQPLLVNRVSQSLIATAARSGALPMHALYRILH